MVVPLVEGMGEGIVFHPLGMFQFRVGGMRERGGMGGIFRDRL